MDLIGQQIGKYRIECVLGTGGTATVFQGVHEQLNRKAAIKIMHAHLAEDERFLERFHQEAREMAALTHPHVIDIYDFGKDQGLVYLVMEIMDKSLKTYIRQGMFSDENALFLTINLVCQAARALAYVHSQGLVHRDVKPGNLFIRRSSKGNTGTGEYKLKLGDFGIVRPAQTPITTVMLTPAYAPPEQRLRGEKLDGRSDVYSLGCVLFEMIAAQRLVDMENAREAIRDMTSTYPALEGILMRCIAEDRDERYETAEELAIDLQRFAEDSTPTKPTMTRRSNFTQSVVPRDQSTAEKTSSIVPIVKRTRASMIPAIMGMLACLAVIFLSFVKEPQATPEPPVSQTKPLSAPSPPCRVTAAALNLREGPGMTYETHRALPQATGFKPLSQIGPWIEIEVHGKGWRGYIHRAYVQCIDINSSSPGRKLTPGGSIGK